MTIIKGDFFVFRTFTNKAHLLEVTSFRNGHFWLYDHFYKIDGPIHKETFKYHLESGQMERLKADEWPVFPELPPNQKMPGIEGISGDVVGIEVGRHYQYLVLCYN